jgi:two-component system, NarL family, nitrate/nitrite response regulator NarL
LAAKAIEGSLVPLRLTGTDLNEFHGPDRFGLHRRRPPDVPGRHHTRGLQHPDFRLVGEAGDGQVALEEIRSLRPQVALVDVDMPQLDGIELLGRIVRECLPTAVVLLSAHLSAHAIFRSMSAGASGYVTKEADRDTILGALEAAARGAVRMPPDVQTELVSELRRHMNGDRPRLSTRELEVLCLVAEGLTTPQIASQLVLGIATVKSHLQTLYEKLGVSDRASAVAVAMREGILA